MSWWYVDCLLFYCCPDYITHLETTQDARLKALNPILGDHVLKDIRIRYRATAYFGTCTEPQLQVIRDVERLFWGFFFCLNLLFVWRVYENINLWNCMKLLDFSHIGVKYTLRNLRENTCYLCFIEYMLVHFKFGPFSTFSRPLFVL